MFVKKELEESPIELHMMVGIVCVKKDAECIFSFFADIRHKWPSGLKQTQMIEP